MYQYHAYERPGNITSTVSAALGPTTDRLMASTPDELISLIANRIAPLGDGPRRLRDLASKLWAQADRHELMVAAVVASVLEGEDNTFRYEGYGP